MAWRDHARVCTDLQQSHQLPAAAAPVLSAATALEGDSGVLQPCNLLMAAPAGSCACRAGAMWREATTWPMHSGGRRRWGRSAGALATSTPSGGTGALTASPQLCRAPLLCLRQLLYVEQHD